jgi:hypothetical protein
MARRASPSRATETAARLRSIEIVSVGAPQRAGEQSATPSFSTQHYAADFPPSVRTIR